MAVVNRAARVDRRLGLPWQVEVEADKRSLCRVQHGVSGKVLVGHEGVRIHCLASRVADGQLDSDGGPVTLV
jgi:hypothetical protein